MDNQTNFHFASNIATEFKQAYQNNSVSHAYLFEASDSKLLKNTALWVACLFLCEDTSKNRPDLTCRNCTRILEMNHPDVFFVEEEEKQNLGIDLIRPLKEELAKSPVEGQRRFFIVNDAQKLTLSAANAMLNLLEEPIAPVITILLTNNANQILPTITSRVQLIKFKNDTDKSLSFEANLGLSSVELNQLDDITELKSLLDQFYYQLFNNDQLAILTAKELTDQNLNRAQQSFVFAYLQQKADQELIGGNNYEKNTEILSVLLKINEMRQANVGFSNCLNYLILKIEF